MKQAILLASISYESVMLRRIVWNRFIEKLFANAIKAKVSLFQFLHFRYNGWSDPSMDNLIATECRGICGRVILIN